MRAKKKLLWSGLLLLALCIAGYAGLASAGEDGSPGSVNDPLVTKSFVVKYVQESLAQLGQVKGGGSLEWSTSALEPGQQFIGKSGTEFIVRSGEAVVVDPSGSGIVDLTAGKNVSAGMTAEKNHLFTIPREDGRGVTAVKQTIIMYRGY
ncbi:hypothetical protein [Desulfotruncus alcoholivorax]|uniref:hypothetical protein n=1 Tax=Desulfotruncus alcoholivorax TaxID=265477 RepID=UPI00048780DA|nr:hypothetical protein [Desulfotruncus alcoholivorax]